MTRARTPMPVLRTVVATWIASLAGIASTLAFLAVTGPFAPMLLDALIAGSIFIAVGVTAFVFLRRGAGLISTRRPHAAL